MQSQKEPLVDPEAPIVMLLLVNFDTTLAYEGLIDSRNVQAAYNTPVLNVSAKVTLAPVPSTTFFTFPHCLASYSNQKCGGLSITIVIANIYAFYIFVDNTGCVRSIFPPMSYSNSKAICVE